MTYRQTIAFLFNSLPMFQRIGDAAIKKDLTNIRKLVEMLGPSSMSFPTLHIAGTNGKGSTSHMLASLFQAQGKKTGLYTSPHYVDFRERIRINGEMISQNEVIHFVENYKSRWQEIEPSFFEITVAMAFDHFKKHEVDIAIIETGLGGRLDSTNIIHPLLSIITNIGFDHTQFLGDTLPKIAFEKAGIIKSKTPVIIGEWNTQTAKVFKEKARKENAPIHFASRHLQLIPVSKSLSKNSFSVHVAGKGWIEKLQVDLTGPYQQKNIVTVLETIWCWNKYFPNQAFTIPQIRKGLSNVKSATQMMGRWMILNKAPLVITDAAHNEHGMIAMLPELLEIHAKQRHFVLGFVNDKEIRKILKHFPQDGNYYWCSPDIPRGKPAAETREIGAELCLIGKAFSSVFGAFKAAMKYAGGQDLVFVGGSSYVVGDFLNKKTLQR